MAHHRNIPIAFSFQPERRAWELVSFSRADPLPTMPFASQANDTIAIWGSSVPATGTTLLTDSGSGRIRLRYDKYRGLVMPETIIRIHSEAINTYVEAVLGIERHCDRKISEAYTQLLVSWPGDPTPPREANPWAMRDEFLQLTETNEALQGFLNRWGLWDSSGRFKTDSSEFALLGQQSPVAVLPGLVWQRRKDLREAMLGKADAWLKGRSTLGYTHGRDRYPFIGVTDSTCSRAIETTITLDHLGRTKFRTCKRPDCNNIFPVESDHGKVFCQQYCGHLVSLRRKRAAAKRVKRVVAKRERNDVDI